LFVVFVIGNVVVVVVVIYSNYRRNDIPKNLSTRKTGKGSVGDGSIIRNHNYECLQLRPAKLENFP